jgi:hypothetical protein
MARQSWGAFRFHGGYGFQENGNSVLIGADRALGWGGRTYLVRADLVQVNAGQDWMPSVGLLHGVSPSLVLEAWASQVLASEQAPWFMLKVNLIP